jgi:hypothetical protein
MMIFSFLQMIEPDERDVDEFLCIYVKRLGGGKDKPTQGFSPPSEWVRLYSEQAVPEFSS